MIAKNKEELIKLIQSDYYRGYGKIEDIKVIAKKAIKKPLHPMSFMFWFRIVQYGKCNRFVRWYAAKMYIKISRIRNLDIPLSTDIGYGFYLGHCMCIVINGGTKIGNNVNISQFLNIGTNNNTPATIGNNVYIGPHVCIVEDVNVGNCVTIGAGAVVTKDIPNSVTVVGVPAHVIGENHSYYIQNPYLY